MKAMPRPNTGSVFEYPKGSGIWRAQATVDGRKVRRKAKSEAEGKRLLRKLLDQADDDAIPKDSRLLVRRFLADWLLWVKEHREYNTYANYEQYVRLIISPEIGSIVLAKLGVDDIERMMRLTVAHGKSLKQANKARMVLYSALKWAASSRRKLIPRNVAADTEPLPLPFVAVEPIRSMSEEQVWRFLDVARWHRLGVLFFLELVYGLRKSEVIGLKDEDVKREEGIIHIRRKVQRQKGMGLVEGPVKMRRPRVVPLYPFVVPELDAWLAVRDQEKHLVGSYWHETGRLFTNTVGEPLEQSWLSKELNKLLESAGVPHFRFHDLRHSSATFMDMVKIRGRVRSDILGHKHEQMTDHYTHALMEDLRDVGPLIESFFAPKLLPAPITQTIT